MGQRKHLDVMHMLVLTEDSVDEVNVHAVQSKRVDSSAGDTGHGIYTVKCVLGDIENIGYRRCIAKSVQEPVMKAMMERSNSCGVVKSYPCTAPPSLLRATPWLGGPLGTLMRKYVACSWLCTPG